MDWQQNQSKDQEYEYCPYDGTNKRSQVETNTVKRPFYGSPKELVMSFVMVVSGVTLYFQ